MTAILYPDCFAISPNGRYRLSARSPHNGTIPHRDGRAATNEEHEFRFRQHQSHFRYQLADDTGGVLWERWQPDGEDSPGEVLVSDDGWSILCTHGFHPQVIAVSPGGEHVMRVSITGPYSTPSETPDEGLSWLATGLSWTTAGMYWTVNALPYFLRLDGSNYFAWRTSWGQRLVLNLSAGALVGEAEQAASALAVAVAAAEVRTVRDLLAELTARMPEALDRLQSRPSYGDDDDDDDDDDDEGEGDEEDHREPDSLDFRLFLLRPALHLAGVHRLTDCVPILRRWEAVDRDSYRTGTFAIPGASYDAQAFRPICQQALRRLDREPAGYAAYYFRFDWPREERIPAPERLPDRRARTTSLKKRMLARDVLDLLGPPDHLRSESHRNEKNLYDWTEDWEYDFRGPDTGRWTTLRITWEEVANGRRAQIRDIEEAASYWLESDRRDGELLRL